MRPLFYWLLLPPAVLLCLFSLAVCGVLLASAPALVVWGALAVLAVVAAWFFFGRRASSSNIAGSETSLMGRQSSKEGLL